ncbi:MAG: glucose-6-phosphate isomerase [Marinilabiliaceae bacterium]|jgi:glucose-6-phosphate isomerase|nr:glucose-6-phosphate isomerase [Bacteroidales bacterium]MCR5695681.1 glucose-6-phosphate isomerase [Marinilabiliaceae bacterium]
MGNIKLDLSRVYGVVDKSKVEALKGEAEAAIKTLHAGNGAGNDFLGWLNLPSSITDAQFAEIEAAAKDMRSRVDYVVVAGIGGSYLGARAVIEGLSDTFDYLRKDRKNPIIIYAGHNIGEDYLAELLDLLKDKKFGVVVISKSGTTTETAIAFRLLKELVEKTAGKEEAKHRIIAVTDKAKGALKTLATNEGYKTFVIPDNVGGRFSVLTPVGLVPIAIAGYDIRALVKGAADMEKETALDVPFEKNLSMQYAATRNALYRNGKAIEILVNYQPKLHYFTEWWKQLYGESEGKDGKGIFPAGVDFSTDLHSMGQWIQEGERIISETVVSVENPAKKQVIPSDADNLDALNFLAGKRVDQVNKMAELGTLIAHTDGGVPNIHVSVPQLDEYNLGQLIYFFEKACGISGYMLGVNPFNQPGVEAYKKNMFALLEKPGYEEATKAIKERLK